MKKEKDIKEYKRETPEEYGVHVSNDDENDFAYTIVTTNGKHKTLLWSIGSFIISLISIALSFFGLPGAVVGIIGIVFAVLARKFLGFFNKFSLIGLFGGIFGFVIGVAFFVAHTLNIF